jgi:2-deoxy-D-gluconate 3-dehydrogenase
MDEVRGLFKRVLDEMGGQIHIMVNCAGIQRRTPAVSFPESDWDDVCSLNQTSGTGSTNYPLTRLSRRT